jgi:hypothetical protein
MTAVVTRSRPESGFAMLLVFVMAAAIAITLYIEVPRIAFESQRSREQMTIDRALQYQRAIQLFYRKYRLYPQNLDDLETTRNIRFLRHRYKDPLTGKDFRLLHVGPAGQLTDSLIQPAAPLPGSTGGSGPNSAQNSSQTTAQNGQGSNGQGANGSQPVDPNNPNAQTFDPLNMAARRPSDRIPGASGPGGGTPVDQPPAEPDPNVPQQPVPVVDPNQPAQPPTDPNQPVQPSGQPGQPGVPGQPVPVQQPADPNQPQQPPTDPNQPVPPAGQPGIPGQPPQLQPQFPGQQPFAGQQPPAQNPGVTPLPGQSNPFPQNITPQAGGQTPIGLGSNTNGPANGQAQTAAGLIQGLLTTPRQPPSSVTGFTTGNTGGIAGVASTAEGKGIHVVNDHTKYKEWEFVYDIKKDKTVVGAQGVAAQQQMQQQMQQPGALSGTSGSSPFGSSPFSSSNSGSTSGSNQTTGAAPAAPTTPPPSQ